jgi:cell division protein FtsI (penicillin-binding protein 3)
MKIMDREKLNFEHLRGHFVMGVFALAALGLVWRAGYLQITHKDFYQNHGNERHLREVKIPAHRGMITDRNGEPLAVSTPVDTICGVPRLLLQSRERWPELAKALNISTQKLAGLIEPRGKGEFAYLRRHANPAIAERVMALGIEGVWLESEYQRYYPASEVTAHVVGFTDIDDGGQEGLELAYDEYLQGESGAKRVIKDRIGRIVENVESISPPSPGKELVLSIDKRLQYVAYRELKEAMFEHKAKAGSVVILDASKGEVLAMVNQPSYNPNNRRGLQGRYFRNRAMTDVFEPGSTMKPFTMAAALESKTYEISSVVDTRPGYFWVGRHKVQDIHNYGRLDGMGIIGKSSNIGMAKIALALEPKMLWETFNRLGFGAVTGTGFPGERSGYLNDYQNWRTIDHATISFGYGVSVTPLQLAQAYMVFATDGVLLPVSLLRLPEAPAGQRVLSPEVARTMLGTLEGVILNGTGRRASVAGYRVAGKTGTVHKTSTTGGYSEDSYRSLFTGILPVSRPRLVTVVMIDEPRNGEYYGGSVAAPVFANIMREVVRLLDLPPDEPPAPEQRKQAFLAGLPTTHETSTITR